jgi:hypothetical protein
VKAGKVDCGYKWTATLGHQNWAIYQPGERVTAVPGCPVYPDNWVVAWWYPGTSERVSLTGSLEEAKKMIDAIL